MKVQKIQNRGTEINKVAFSEIERYLEDKGLDVMKAFFLMADENEFVYVSNGFINGLKTETSENEWHHFFTKDGKDFNAGKFSFIA